MDAEKPQTAAPLTYEDVVFQSAPCPVCGSPDHSDPVLTGRDFIWHKRGRATLVSCLSCETVYQNPRPSPGTMRYYYEDCYSGDWEERMRSFKLESPVFKLMNLYRTVTLEKVRKLQAGDAVLDVGASYGSFLEYVRVKRGVRAYGVDLDPGSVESFVNKTDIDVRCGDLLEEGYDADSFDVVTLFETLEHVHEPVATLQEVRRILKPGGLVSIEVPSWDGIARALFGSSWFPLLLPTHLQHFSRRTLARCVQEAGLEVVHHQAMFFPGEFACSLGIAISRLLGHMPDEEKSLLRRALDVPVFFLLLAVMVFIDVPLTFWLRWFGRSGHQTLVARCPE